ncbi:hypothetical protein CIW54_27970 (plasmid) [Paraburkholderia sp. T12-10]|nr:hypothetical protein CIW54_27970 [Paraburkholderia sp. T12-10]
MSFNMKSNASGNLFRLTNDLLVEGCQLWVGSVTTDNKEVIVASAEPMFNRQHDGNGFSSVYFRGFALAFGTTDPIRNRFGYYATLSPIEPFPGSEMVGYLKHYEQELADVFLVRAAYATTADGTSRLSFTIERVAEQPTKVNERVGEAF